MQGRSRPLLQMISWLRAVRVSVKAPSFVAGEASPVLILTVVVLALLLAILEVDMHSVDFRSLGLMGEAFSIDPVFKSP